MWTVPSGRSEDRTRTPAYAGHPPSKRCPTPTLGWSYLESPLPDSNRPPAAYKAAALPDELKGRDVRCRCVRHRGRFPASPRVQAGLLGGSERSRLFVMGRTTHARDTWQGSRTLGFTGELIRGTEQGRAGSLAWPVSPTEGFAGSARRPFATVPAWRHSLLSGCRSSRNPFLSHSHHGQRKFAVEMSTSDSP